MSFDTTWAYTDLETVKFEYIGTRDGGNKEYALRRGDATDYLPLSATDLLTMRKVLGLFIRVNGIGQEAKDAQPCRGVLPHSRA